MRFSVSRVPRAEDIHISRILVMSSRRDKREYEVSSNNLGTGLDHDIQLSRKFRVLASKMGVVYGSSERDAKRQAHCNGSSASTNRVLCRCVRSSGTSSIARQCLRDEEK